MEINFFFFIEAENWHKEYHTNMVFIFNNFVLLHKITELFIRLVCQYKNIEMCMFKRQGILRKLQCMCPVKIHSFSFCFVLR